MTLKKLTTDGMTSPLLCHGSLIGVDPQLETLKAEGPKYIMIGAHAPNKTGKCNLSGMAILAARRDSSISEGIHRACAACRHFIAEMGP